MTTSVGQAILGVVESDIATVAGAPLLSFLQACQAANGNKALEAVAVVQLVAAAPAAGLNLEITVEQQLIALVTSKLTAFITAKATVAAAAK